MRLWIEKNPRIFNDESLVELFLEPKRELFFENRNNGWYGKEHIFKFVAEYWLKTGEFGDDYDDVTIIQAQSRWEQFLELFEEKGEIK
jgi:hypothetical protein